MPWCRGCASRYHIEPWYRALGRLGRNGRRQSRTPPARDLKAGDTRRQPQHPSGIPTHHVAEIVHAEVQSTEPDGDDQEGGTEHHGDSRAPTVDPEKREHVGEHTVPDERGHRVAAREAPTEVLEERGGTGRPRAANHDLEYHIEQTAAGEGREPAGEQGPLTSRCEEEAHSERQDSQRHRRAEDADRIEDGVPGGWGMCVQ